MALIVTLLAASLALCMPVLLAALGELVNERSGVLNVGLEGVMLFGAFGAAFTYQLWGNFALAFGFGLLAGLCAWAILGALYLWRQTEQIVTGLLFNLFAFGLTATLFTRFEGDVGQVRALPKVSFGPLTDIPILGPILFNQNIVVYAAIIIVVGVSLLLNRTWFGLRIKAAGEIPLVAYENGVPVMRLRWIALGIGCVLASLGGAALVLAESGIFLPGVTSGAGFIALAMVVLGRFSAYGILLASIFFGVAASLQFYSEQLPFASGGARYFWVAFPYIATLVALAVWRKARYPAAMGKEFKV